MSYSYTGSLLSLILSLSRCREEATFSIPIFLIAYTFLLSFSRYIMDMAFSIVFFVVFCKSDLVVKEEIEILIAASSRYLLNYVINIRSDPVNRLIPSVSDLNSNSQQPRLGNTRNISLTNNTMCDIRRNIRCR